MSDIIQMNYEQNDSTASDYIKNRPFYKEIGETIFDQDVTTEQTTEDSGIFTYAHPTCIDTRDEVTNSDAYDVVFNGELYAFMLLSNGYIGNPSIFYVKMFEVLAEIYDKTVEELVAEDPSISPLLIDTGEPFFIQYNFSSDNSTDIYTREAGTYHFTITKATFHKLNSGFINMDDIKVLPDVTSNNDGQILGVKDGTWSIIDMPKTLPEVTTDDNNKVLMVTDGAWSVGSISV